MSTYSDEFLRSDGQFVPGLIHSDVTPFELLLAEKNWLPERVRIYETLKSAGDEAAFPQSLGWNWSKKAPLLGRLEVSGYGISIDGVWQALMMTKSASCTTRHPDDRGKPLVYVDYLEVAPWNWPVPSMSQRPRHKGLGSRLLMEAVNQSVREGFHGRVGLHSLPQSEQFYQGIFGMAVIERDVDKENLLYLELTREQARTLIEKGAR